jgi:hypothetical protein
VGGASTLTVESLAPPGASGEAATETRRVVGEVRADGYFYESESETETESESESESGSESESETGATAEGNENENEGGRGSRSGGGAGAGAGAGAALLPYVLPLGGQDGAFVAYVTLECGGGGV